jgi:predicted nucleotidyltransferase
MESILNICRRYPVRELAIFGSALRDDFGAESDIDLLVDFQPDAQVGFLTLAAMSRELSEALGRKVDLIPKGGLKPRIRTEVLAAAEVLYAA